MKPFTDAALMQTIGESNKNEKFQNQLNELSSHTKRKHSFLPP